MRDLTVSQDDEDILKHVSFNVLPGEKVALVGRAGAEKHALLASIFQFMETRGSIKIDGVNIAWVSLVLLMTSYTKSSLLDRSRGFTLTYHFCYQRWHRMLWHGKDLKEQEA